MQVEAGPVAVWCSRCSILFPLVSFPSHLLLDHDMTLGQARVELVRLAEAPREHLPQADRDLDPGTRLPSVIRESETGVRLYAKENA